MNCKCGGIDFFTKKSGEQVGLYCSKCGKWQKWLSKDEQRLYQRESQMSEIKKKIIDALEYEIFNSKGNLARVYAFEKAKDIVEMYIKESVDV